ncbi:reverse transcriptase domain-containing protein [Tanacetum coccineum]
MKQLTAELPMLTAPMEKEELIIYLAAAKETVSAVLMTEREAKQMPIYFVCKALRGPEVNYTSMEKLVLALVLSRSEVAGRLQKWSIELGEYAIHYRPRVSVKGKILADFIVERPEEESPDTLMEVEEELPELFDATNNEAKYEALIAGLRIVEQMSVKNLQANVDSRLVANQVNGTYVAKEADMIRYLEKVRTLTSSFRAFSISKQVLVEELKEKSISEMEILAVVEEEGDTWMTPIFEYLKDETLPTDVKKARAVRRKSQRFAVINGTLYRKSFLGLWLRCVGPLQANYDNPFKDWCEKLCIRQHFASVKHPQNNDLVERANRSLEKGIKARLGARNKKWMEELSHVLWAHRTMIKSSNGDTPFSLTYRIEEVIPAEIGMLTLRTTEVDLVQNNEALEIKLEFLVERREQVSIREAKSKARTEKYYNSKVKNTSFKPGDLVYCNNDASSTEGTRKLGPKWEGPYEVTEALGKGAQKLRDRDGNQLPQT